MLSTVVHECCVLAPSFGARTSRILSVWTASLRFPHESAILGTNQFVDESRRVQMNQSEPWVSLEQIFEGVSIREYMAWV